MFGSVTVVVPTTNGFQVPPSVEYSSDTDGAEEPCAVIFTVELASSAVKQSQFAVGGGDDFSQIFSVQKYASVAFNVPTKMLVTCIVPKFIAKPPCYQDGSERTT